MSAERPPMPADWVAEEVAHRFKWLRKDRVRVANGIIGSRFHWWNVQKILREKYSTNVSAHEYADFVEFKILQ